MLGPGQSKVQSLKSFKENGMMKSAPGLQTLQKIAVYMESSGNNMKNYLLLIGVLKSSMLCRYTKTQNRSLRFVIFGLAMLMVVMLPTLLLVKYVQFLNDDTVSNNVEWLTAKNLTYPNITVCHPSYFDVHKMQSKNR